MKFCINQNCFDLPQPEGGYNSAKNSSILTMSESTTLECAQSYQLTEMLPNPLMTQWKTTTTTISTVSDEFDIKFTIGDGRCNELVEEGKTCNPPLPRDMRIGLMLRVYTENGFKDSDEIIFLDYQPVSSASILTPTNSVAFVLLGIIILSFVICICCCSAKKKETIKEESQVEADENLLSFTSYCVIDKNPSKHSNV